MSGLPLMADIKASVGGGRKGPRHEVAALQPAARGQEPRGREPGEKIVVAMESSRPENRVLQTSLRKELSMSETNTVSPLRQRMIEDMAGRKLNPHTQRSHIHSCKRFAAWLKHSPDTATPDEVRQFQLYLIESGMSICNRNRIMTGVRFLYRVTLRRHDLAAEVWHIKEPERLPPVLSPEEVKRVLTMATSLKARAMLTLAYGAGCGPVKWCGCGRATLTASR